MMETRAREGDHTPQGTPFAVSIKAEVSQQYPHAFTWAPVCVGAGVGAYFALPFEPEPWFLTVLFCMIAVLWLGVRAFGIRDMRGALIVLWAATLGVAGISIASLRAHMVAEPVLGFRYYGPIEGRIVAIDASASQKMRLTLDQVRLSRLRPDEMPKRVRVSLHGPEIGVRYEPGDRVMTTGHLGPPSGPVEPGGFDFQRHLWFQQLGALGYTRNPVLRLAPVEDAGWRLRLYALRLTLSEAIKSRMSPKEGPFAAAIITGDRSALDPASLEMLRASNLAHLLAISGLHMGLLTGAVFFLVRLVLGAIPAATTRVSTRKIAAVAAFVAAFLYLGVSGANVATQRAFIMVSVMLLAICLERPAMSLRAVAMAALIILVIRPEALVGPGFQMSFAATTALVAVFGVIRDKGVLLVFPRWASGAAALVLSSLIAGLATAPFGAAHFNQVAQYGLLANLTSVPVMGFVVMPGAVLAGCLAPIGLEGAGLWVMELGVAWILKVAGFIASLEGSTRAIVAPDAEVLPLVTLGGLLLCLWQGRGRVMGVIPLLAAAVIWSGAERPDVLISDTGRLVGVLQNGQRGLNKPKGDGFAARVWLENDGDASDQPTAAKRSGFRANDLELSLAGKTLLFNAANPEKIDVAASCASADLVVLPRLEQPLPKSCKGWAAPDFAKDGALAIYVTDAGLRYENSRSRQGNRLWVSNP